jgi:hypothetical protein
MAKHNCENCNLRARYDKNPRSIIGRFWRWHINWCPGWKKYITSLSDEDRNRILRTYNIKKYQNGNGTIGAELQEQTSNHLK